MITSHLTQALIPYEIAAKWAKGRGFADSYAWHQRIWETFPNRVDAPRDFLTRIDPAADGYRLLLLSREIPIRPDWCPLAGWKTKTIHPDFLSHPIYRFSLLANPTRKVRAERDGKPMKNGRREPITHREDIELNGKIRPGLVSWMLRKAEQHGFQVDASQLKTIPQPRQFFVKAGIAGMHSATDFQGSLKVVNPELFVAAFHQGIGSAKAFGFGMLCLAPILHSPS